MYIPPYSWKTGYSVKLSQTWVLSWRQLHLHGLHFGRILLRILWMLKVCMHWKSNYRVHRQKYPFEMLDRNTRDLILLKGYFCFKKLLNSKSLDTLETTHCLPHLFDLPSKSACCHWWRWDMGLGQPLVWLSMAALMLWKPSSFCHVTVQSGFSSFIFVNTFLPEVVHFSGMNLLSSVAHAFSYIFFHFNYS